MIKHIRNRHFFFYDLSIIPIVVYFSFVLRLERFDIAPFWGNYAIFTVIAIVLIPLGYRATGVYSRFWQYASIDELLLLAGSTTLSALATGALSFVVAYLWPTDIPFARSIAVIYLLISLGVSALPRLLLRLRRRISNPSRGLTQPVVIMGAGDAGEMMVRELHHSPHLKMHVVAFIDDDAEKHGMRIHGVPVIGNRHQIPTIVQKHRVSQVLIAMPTAPGKVIREILQICEDTNVKTKILPGIFELLDGTVSVSQIRDVEIEDLLRREPIRIDTQPITELLGGRRVLITGGGGSIGSELCRQVLRCQPAELVIVGHGENSVFAINNELKRLAKNGNLKTVINSHIADIRFPERIDHIVGAHLPDIIFHAAAHKHVPLMEANPCEAITNNVLGTRNLLQAASQHNVARFVMISTDKAVNPTSMMGASKRTAELLVHQTARETGKPYVAVRFGNVLGSRGSVVLTFKEQIANGGPITVTHPDMERFFMTIPEAVQLVLQAAVLGEGGEVFLLDMGDPVKIVDLASDLIELSGLEVGHDIDIVFSGARPGEKLYEELFVEGEDYQRTRHEKIFIAANASRFVPHGLDESIVGLEQAALASDSKAIYHQLKALIPEYQPRINSKGNATKLEHSGETKLPLPAPGLQLVPKST